MKSAMHSPEIMSLIESVRGVKLGTGEGILKSLAMLPLVYFSKAYWDGVSHGSMTDEDFVVDFIRRNPEISKYLAGAVARRAATPLLFP